LHVSEFAVVERVVNDLGLSGAALVAQAQSSEIKSLLRKQTEDAISKGVFGVPTMQVDNELFWGYDDFPYLELFIAGRDPLDPRQLEKWRRTVRPSSVRRRFRAE
jgi:2-hydroxychromene-2-carboxylate isomerase